MNNRHPKQGQTAPPAGPSWRPGLFSLLVPGGGQYALGKRERGLGVLIAVAALIGLILWREAWVLLVPLAVICLWNAWDAYRLAGGRQTSVTLPLLLGALIVYTLGVSATEVRPGRLISDWTSVKPYLKALTEPELLAYPTEDVQGHAPFQVPCVDPLPEPAKAPTPDPRVATNVACAEVGDWIEVRGEGFLPDTEGEFWWANPIGDVQRVIVEGEPLNFMTDAQGEFTATLKVPLAVPLTQIPGPGETQTHLIRAEQHKPYGSLQMTETLRLVLEKIGETVALAFMATVLGVLFAVPVSFLAARNLMEGNRATRVVYYVVRTTLNIVRSIETLIWAIVFAVWVGLGPFAGMLALMLHTVAALGKLYSEAIESIDPGPMEALRATGATGPQIVVYAVLPQIVPTFLSFTLYRWDINVRMSTVIGLVSDAGLGFLVVQWIRLNRFRSMATAIIAIVLVVAILDYVSAWIRQRIISGTPSLQPPGPVRRYVTRGLVIAILLVTFVWSWRVSKIDLVDFVRGAPAGLRLARDFLVPEMFTRPSKEHEVSITLPVPCDAGDTESATVSGARVNLSRSCGEVGDPLTIRGHELPPDANVSVRWVFPDGGYLRVKSNCCTADDTGRLELETTVHPLMEVDPEAEDVELGRVVINWKEVIGGPQLSDAFKIVFNLALVTLLMALIATTLGSVFAIPLSFFAARNIVGHGPIGSAVYYFFRTLFNLWRSVEPLILALIASAWVGPGPFAGVLALSLNNIPNLGKLFSETIEEINPGPVEAIRATGANRMQVLAYAVVPQLVPKFLAFILYTWDINIRMSTVIGFVGGGGIGQQFRLWVGLNQYASAGMATWAIVAMVWTMDYMSARARQTLT
jgi:phosphonate transport system permease protein